MHVKTKDREALKMLEKLESILVSINTNLSMVATSSGLNKDNTTSIAWNTERSKDHLAKVDQKLVGLENSLSVLSFRMGEVAKTMARQQKMMEKLYGIENVK